MFGIKPLKYDLQDNKLTIIEFEAPEKERNDNGTKIILLQNNPIPKANENERNCFGYLIETDSNLDNIYNLSRFGIEHPPYSMYRMPLGEPVKTSNPVINRFLEKLLSKQLKEGEFAPEDLTQYLHNHYKNN